MAGMTKELMTVEEVRARLEEWRRNRQGRAAIPEELWSSAIEVARRDGVGHTATALGLDYGKLKRLMLAADGVEKRTTTPSFRELIAPKPRLLRSARSNWRGGAARSGSSLRPTRLISQASAGRWGSWFCDPDHAASTHSGCGGACGRKEGDRFFGAGLPGETWLRSVFRLPVYLPQPQRAGDPDPGLRRPGILAGHQAPVQGTLSLVANGHGSGPKLARASGPDAAGGWQSGNRSRARMAACERMKNLRHHGLAFQFPFCHTYDRWQRWSGNTGAVSSRRKISNLSGSSSYNIRA